MGQLSRSVNHSMGQLSHSMGQLNHLMGQLSQLNESAQTLHGSAHLLNGSAQSLNRSAQWSRQALNGSAQPHNGSAQCLNESATQFAQFRHSNGSAQSPLPALTACISIHNQRITCYFWYPTSGPPKTSHQPHSFYHTTLAPHQLQHTIRQFRNITRVSSTITTLIATHLTLKPLPALTACIRSALHPLFLVPHFRAAKTSHRPHSFHHNTLNTTPATRHQTITQHYTRFITINNH